MFCNGMIRPGREIEVHFEKRFGPGQLSGLIYIVCLQAAPGLDQVGRLERARLRRAGSVNQQGEGRSERGKSLKIVHLDSHVGSEAPSSVQEAKGGQ